MFWNMQFWPVKVFVMSDEVDMVPNLGFSFHNKQTKISINALNGSFSIHRTNLAPYSISFASVTVLNSLATGL